jgi:hypothetical protein
MADNDQSAADLEGCSVLYSRPNLSEEGGNLYSGSGQKVSIRSWRDYNWRL